MKSYQPAKLYLVILFLCTAIVLKAQTKTEKLSQQELEKIIINIDTEVFDAYNSCDVKKFSQYFTVDVEFYHDKGGLTKTIPALAQSLQNGLCNPISKWRTRREIVPGSLKVYPLNKYGAILVGEHKFFESESGVTGERHASTAKFTHVFQENNGVWKISRVLSYDHQLPK